MMLNRPQQGMWMITEQTPGFIERCEGCGTQLHLDRERLQFKAGDAFHVRVA